MIISQNGWTPGATGAGTPPALTPAQTLALVFDAIGQGVQVATTVYGAITAADASTGMVTLADGSQVPISQVGGIQVGATTTTPAVTLAPTADEGEGKAFELTPTMMMMIGGLGLVLLVALKK